MNPKAEDERKSPFHDDERKGNFLFLKERNGKRTPGTMTTGGVLAGNSGTSSKVFGDNHNMISDIKLL